MVQDFAYFSAIKSTLEFWVMSSNVKKCQMLELAKLKTEQKLQRTLHDARLKSAISMS